jgi:hypothetical protein
MGSEMLLTWGPGRTRRVNPLDQWLAADPDDLASLTPVFTIVGGRPTHDRDKRLTP